MSTSFTFMSHLLNKEKAEILAPVNLSVPESSNREILLEWIFEICESNKYSQKSRELAVAYIDSFLASQRVQLQYWQLLGITALSIALKSSEAAMLSNEDCISVSGSQYTIEQLNEMEIQILQTLSWNLNLVTPSDYIEPLQQHFDFDARKVFDIVSFMNLNQSFLGVKPSLIVLVALNFTYSHLAEDSMFQSILAQLPAEDQSELQDLLLVLKDTLLNFHSSSSSSNSPSSSLCDENTTQIYHVEEDEHTPKRSEVKKIKKHIRKVKN